MSMSQQRVLTIYICPRNGEHEGGPIKAVQIDLMAVEMVALRNPDNYQHEEIRLREMAKQIKEQVKRQWNGDIYPERSQDQLKQLLTGLGNYRRFQGVVIEVPGTIPEDVSGKAAVSEEIKKKLEQINQEVVRLTRELRDEREAHGEDQKKLAIVRGNYKTIRLSYDNLSSQFVEAQQNEKLARQDSERWRKATERLTADAGAAQQEIGNIRLHLERASREMQTLKKDFQEKQQHSLDQEQELSGLRLADHEAKSMIKHLEEDLHEKEQQIFLLKQQLFADPLESVTRAGRNSWESNL